MENGNLVRVLEATVRDPMVEVPAPDCSHGLRSQGRDGVAGVPRSFSPIPDRATSQC
jgi:hypothetical protein